MIIFVFMKEAKLLAQEMLGNSEANLKNSLDRETMLITELAFIRDSNNQLKVP